VEGERKRQGQERRERERQGMREAGFHAQQCSACGLQVAGPG
jgi:hypothetical protein